MLQKMCYNNIKRSKKMTITVKIDNPDLEERLIEFVKQQKQDLEEITIEALNNFIEMFH
jgi:hypothetical protein